MTLPPGKVPIEVLRKLVYEKLGASRDDVLVGPEIGEDGAVLKAGSETLVVSSDPISGAVEQIGWLAVHVCANDVATHGVRPRWYVSCILLPEGSEEGIVAEICGQIDLAAKEIGVAVVGGHTEVTPGLDHPLVVGAMVGVAEEGKYVTTGGARVNDEIIMTKGAGIEGTAILASDRGDIVERFCGTEVMKKGQAYLREITVLKDALVAFSTGKVTAMHDPTEGGIAGGLHEMADASEKGFLVFKERIKVRRETEEICRLFKVDPLQLIGSGSLLITCDEGSSQQILDRLQEEGVAAWLIGKITVNPRQRQVILEDGGREPLVRPLSDHLWEALERTF
jgi:hydrogenase maturation factor